MLCNMCRIEKLRAEFYDNHARCKQCYAAITTAKATTKYSQATRDKATAYLRSVNEFYKVYLRLPLTDEDIMGLTASCIERVKATYGPDTYERIRRLRDDLYHL